MQDAGLWAGQHSGGEKAGQETAPGEGSDPVQVVHGGGERGTEAGQEEEPGGGPRRDVPVRDRWGERKIELEWPSTSDSAVRKNYILHMCRTHRIVCRLEQAKNVCVNLDIIANIFRKIKERDDKRMDWALQCYKATQFLSIKLAEGQKTKRLTDWQKQNTVTKIWSTAVTYAEKHLHSRCIWRIMFELRNIGRDIRWEKKMIRRESGYKVEQLWGVQEIIVD